MGVMIVMDRTGDSRHSFDPANSAEVQATMQRFNELVASGYTPAKRSAGGEATVSRTFDPTADETLMVPQLVGG